MTTLESEPNPILDSELQQILAEQILDERKRRWLLILLFVLLLLISCVGFFFYRYAMKPEPLPAMLPEVIAKNIVYPPVYKFSIPGVNRPVGVAISPDGQRIYVAESGGDRMIKMFDRDGNLILTFALPGTDPSSRRPSYLAVDSLGQVFVSDNYNHAIDIFDADGKFLDAIIGVDLSLSKAVAAQNGGGLPEGTTYYYNNVDKYVYYQLPGKPLQQISVGEREGWTPLGLRFDSQGNLMVTNLISDKHSVIIFPGPALNPPLLDFNPQVVELGGKSQEDGQLSFPNSVVTDSKGNYYVSDGNNGRISYWTSDLTYKTFFGFGSAESALNLPRGEWMSADDHLHVADAVGQHIRVYDISGDEPTFLYSFGDFGITPGLFNYPTDICMDETGRVYVADRENNQVQVWSY